MQKLTLTREEISELDRLLSELTSRFDSVEDPEFLQESALISHELPRRVKANLLDFKNREPESGVFVLSGIPLDEQRIGPTPERWDQRSTPSPTLREEMMLVLSGALLGDAIAWSTQQNGYLVHDILPMKGMEQEQLGFGSEQPLWWHTEDAFHPYRGDYIGMLCLRNPDKVPTTICSIADCHLDPEDAKLLFEACYPITPDESHLPKNRGNGNGNGHRNDDDVLSSYERIQEQFLKPQEIAVLFGDPSSPYLRLDPYFMKPVVGNPRAQEAFERLTREVDANLKEVALQPGDICFIDNYRAVHGRKPFKARYDGNDRWLKRVNVVRDLRKSRASRSSSMCRVLR